MYLQAMAYMYMAITTLVDLQYSASKIVRLPSYISYVNPLCELIDVLVSNKIKMSHFDDLFVVLEALGWQPMVY